MADVATVPHQPCATSRSVSWILPQVRVGTNIVRGDREDVVLGIGGDTVPFTALPGP